MSINSTLSIARSGIQANQSAINVVSNNIANINTEGYSKQTVNLSEINVYNKINTAQGLVRVGTGVQVNDIVSYRDEYLDAQYRTLNSDASSKDTIAKYSSYVESLFDAELDDEGLTGALNDFYSAAQTLASNPSNTGLRINYIETAQTVASTFNSLYNSVNSYRTSIVGDLTVTGSVENSQTASAVKEINETLEEITKLNSQIMKAQDSSSLITARSQALDELSGLMSFSTNINADGTVDISFNGKSIVSGAEQKASLKCSAGTLDEPCVISLVDKNGDTIKGYENINSSITQGELGGYMQLCSEGDGKTFSITAALNKLNKMANAFANEINDIQMYNDGNVAAMAIGDDNKLTPVGADDYIFQNGAGGATNITAKNITVNADMLSNPNKIATARVEIDESGQPLEPEAIGNNQNLIEVIKTQTEGIADLGNVSPTTYYKNLVTEIGSQSASASKAANTADALLTSVETQRENAMGVNLDEELVNLVKYQSAYSAAARVFSVANELYSTLLTLGQ